MREYLREFRRKIGANQQATADKAEISRTYYNRVENGSRQKNMSLSTLEKLARAFDVPVAELIEAEQRYQAGLAGRKEAG